MDDERLNQMERRIIALESLVRGLLHENGAAPAQLSERASSRTPLRERLAVKALDAKANSADQNVDQHTSKLPPAVRTNIGQTAEQWLGLRGVLGVGVLLIVMAAVFSLIWAVDHGYISPLVRCVGGALFGVGIAAIGWRQYHRELPKYGAALMGTGCAILYLVLWASSQLYGLIPAVIGLHLVRLLCLGLAAIAYRYKEEGLGVIAACGAFVAPVLITAVSSSAFFSMIYLAVVTLSLGAIAVKQRWRSMLNVVSLGFLVSAAFPQEATAPSVQLLWALGYGLGGFAVWRKLSFAEVRLASFFGGWLLLSVARSQGFQPYWMVLVTGLLLAATTWYEGLRTGRVWLDQLTGAGEGKSWGIIATVTFYLTPAFLLSVAVATPSEWLVGRVWFPAAILAIPYLALGYQRIRSHFALLGIGLMLASLHLLLEDTSLVFPVFEVGVIASWLDPKIGRRDGRWFALGAVGLGLSALLNALDVRSEAALAFRDPWALALYVAIMVTALLAHKLWRVYPEERGTDLTLAKEISVATPDGLRHLAALLATPIITALWAVSGTLLFFGVTLEIARLMGQIGLAPGSVTLAAGLAVSAWWACFAGGLFAIGFGRSLPIVRMAGLAVAAVAVGKVLLFDLAELNAFYRVGSFLILGVVLLGVAYLYHRQARGEVVGE